MVKGFINWQYIIKHPIAISSLFGIIFYLKCLYFSLSRKKITFLDLVQRENRF